MMNGKRAGLLAIGVVGWWAFWGPPPAQAQGGSNANDAIQPKLDQRHLWNFDGEKPGEAPGDCEHGGQGCAREGGGLRMGPRECSGGRPQGRQAADTNTETEKERST